MVDYEWMDWAWAQAWQLTALIVVVAIATRCFARRRPHLAYVLWLVVLAKCLTPPFIASPAGIFCRLQSFVGLAAREEWPDMAVHGNDFPSLDWKGVAAAGTLESASADKQCLAQSREGSRLEFDTATIAGEAAWNASPERVEDPFYGGRAKRNIARSFTWLGIVWLAGTLLVVLGTGWRTIACLRRLRRQGVDSRPELQELLVDLRRRLQVRQRVRLLVTQSPIGPAVIGLSRPTIVLPSVVATGRSLKELEAILAHELIHIRRGDLWTGLIQVLAQGVWWFHPLVWFANRRAILTAEACCDQETITELCCDPAAYAESLLDILAIRNKLVPVPAFPGVRPVDVTRERLERIMQIGQGCPRRTPGWCWIAMALVAAATLPGAAIVADGVVEEPVSASAQAISTAVGTQSITSIERLTDQSAEGTATDEISTEPPSPSHETTPSKPVRPFLHWNLPESADGKPGPGRPLVLIEGDRLQRQSAKNDARQSVVEAEGRVMLYVGSVLVLADKALLNVTKGGGNRRNFIEDVSMELSGKVRWSSPDFRLSTHRLVATFRIQGNPKGSDVALQNLSAQSLDVDEAADTHWSARINRLELFSRLPSEMKDPRRLQLAAKQVEVKRHEMPKESGGDQMHYRLEGEVDVRIANLAVGCGECRFIFPATLEPASTASGPTGFAVWAEFEKDVRMSAAPVTGGTALFNEEFSATAQRATFHPFFFRQNDHVVCLGSSLWLSGKATFRNNHQDFSASRMVLKYSPRYPDPNSPQQPLRLSDQIELAGDVRILMRSEAQEQIVQADRVLFDVSTNSVRIDRATRVGMDEPVPPLFGASVTFHPSSEKAKPAVVDRSRFRRIEVGPDDLIITVYPVADQVVPVSKLRVTVTEDGANHLKTGLSDQVASLTNGSPKSRTVDFSQLIELITSTIEPQSWDGVGGPGSIREYQTTLSLVIRQKQQVHDEIADLLGRLRRLQDLQVTLELSALRVPAELTPTLEFSNDDQDVRGALITTDMAVALRKAAEEHSHAGLYQLPRASLLNGQGFEINVPQFGRDVPAFQFVSVISPDRKLVRLSLAVGAQDPIDAMSRVSTFLIPSEKSLLVDVSDELNTKSVAGLRPGQVGAIRRQLKKDSGERCLLLITPRFPPPEKEARVAP